MIVMSYSWILVRPRLVPHEELYCFNDGKLGSLIHFGRWFGYLQKRGHLIVSIGSVATSPIIVPHGARGSKVCHAYSIGDTDYEHRRLGILMSGGSTWLNYCTKLSSLESRTMNQIRSATLVRSTLLHMVHNSGKQYLSKTLPNLRKFNTMQPKLWESEL